MWHRSLSSSSASASFRFAWPCSPPLRGVVNAHRVMSWRCAELCCLPRQDSTDDIHTTPRNNAHHHRHHTHPATPYNYKRAANSSKCVVQNNELGNLGTWELWELKDERQRTTNRNERTTELRNERTTNELRRANERRTNFATNELRRTNERTDFDERTSTNELRRTNFDERTSTNERTSMNERPNDRRNCGNESDHKGF